MLVFSLLLASFTAGCKFPNSAAYVDEYFVHLAPKTTQSIRSAFTRTVMLTKETPAVRLYALMQKQKPEYLFLSPLLSGELPTLMETYPKTVPIILANTQSFTLPMTKGCIIRFDPETALLLAVQRMVKSTPKTTQEGSLAVITDFSVSEETRQSIQSIVSSTEATPDLLFFSANDTELAGTIQELKTKNISLACIAVSGSRLLIVIDAIETKPIVMAVIQGEPPKGKLGKYASVNFLYWDMEGTLKAISPREISATAVQISGKWRFLK